MSFVSLIFSHGKDDELTGSTATRRFERFAEGASEFLRYVELGGTPDRYMFSDPLNAILSLAKELGIALLARVNISHFFYNPLVHYKSMGWRVT